MMIVRKLGLVGVMWLLSLQTEVEKEYHLEKNVWGILEVFFGDLYKSNYTEIKSQRSKAMNAIFNHDFYKILNITTDGIMYDKIDFR